MPARRRTAKTREHRITSEAISAFIEAHRGRDRYIGCIRGEGCRSTSASEHCGECRAHIGASARLSRALGLQLWQMSPLDVDPAEEPPNDHGGNPYDKSWSLACELRAELEKAVGEIEA